MYLHLQRKEQNKNIKKSGTVVLFKQTGGCTVCPRGDVEKGQKCEESVVCRETPISRPSHTAGNILILAAKPRTDSGRRDRFKLNGKPKIEHPIKKGGKETAA